MAFTLSHEDWSLSQRGEVDEQRHEEKVREAIRAHLPEIVTEEGIILEDGEGKKLRIPVRSIEEYRFIYDRNQQPHVGQGNGSSQIGDRLGPAGQPLSGQQEGGASDQPGQDYEEAEVSLEEISELLFADWELPDLRPKQQDRVMAPQPIFDDVRKVGISSNIDRKRTLLESIRRSRRQGSRRAILPQDVRYRTWEEEERPQENAVVFAMMDTSGSMGSFEKYVARAFFFWMTRFLRTKYQNVEIVYIAHHTQAAVVDEQHFFAKGESGGTVCSSAYQLANRLIAEKYPPQRYNLYPIHFTDGDNLASDNERALAAFRQLVTVSNLAGYGEINPYGRSSTLLSTLRQIRDPRFRSFTVREQKDVYEALRFFFSTRR